jgi:hypothetical protein
MAIAKQPIKSGLMNQPLPVDADKPRMTKEQVAAYIERMRAYDSEMVTGIFENLEAPGQGFRFSIHLYPGDEFDTYELFDGERYRIPRGVARWLNQGCCYKQYAELPALGQVTGTSTQSAVAVKDGRYQGFGANMTPVSKKYRVSFKSLEFSDDTLDFFQSSMFMPANDKIFPNVVA